MLNVKNLNIAPALLQDLCEIDEFKGSWRALEQHTTALNLLGDVAHFGQNVQGLLGPLKNKTIDVQIVQALHQAFAKGSKPGFRDTDFPLIIQQGEEIMGTLDTAAPEDIDILMPKLLDWLNGALAKKMHHPIVIIGMFAAVFLQISPFEKGNQKVLRVLILLFMMKEGYVYAPYAPLDDILNARAHSYFEVLQKTQESVEAGRPEWAEWLMFFTDVLKVQKNKLQVKIETEEKDLGSLPTLSAQIMNLFTQHQRLQMKEIIKLTNGRRSTIKLRLQELVDDGYLVRHGQARSTWYAMS